MLRAPENTHTEVYNTESYFDLYKSYSMLMVNQMLVRIKARGFHFIPTTFNISSGQN